MERRKKRKVKRGMPRTMFLCVMACVLLVYAGLWIYVVHSAARMSMAGCVRQDVSAGVG